MAVVVVDTDDDAVFYVVEIVKNVGTKKASFCFSFAMFNEGDVHYLLMRMSHMCHNDDIIRLIRFILICIIQMKKHDFIDNYLSLTLYPE